MICYSLFPLIRGIHAMSAGERRCYQKATSVYYGMLFITGTWKSDGVVTETLTDSPGRPLGPTSPSSPCKHTQTSRWEDGSGEPLWYKRPESFQMTSLVSPYPLSVLPLEAGGSQRSRVTLGRERWRCVTNHRNQDQQLLLNHFFKNVFIIQLWSDVVLYAALRFPSLSLCVVLFFYLFCFDSLQNTS